MTQLAARVVHEELRPEPSQARANVTELAIVSTPRVEFMEPEFLVPGELMLGTLADQRIRVIAPIEVRLFEEEGQVVAQAPAFDEFGFGANASEALQDIQHALAQLYYSLGEMQND